MNERVGHLASATLFDGDVGGTNVHLSITYSLERGIEIAGSDFGSAPRGVFGASEYEYWRSVKAEHADQVFYGLLKEAGAPHEPFTAARLIELTCDRFGGTHDAEKHFRQWCEAKGIPTDFFSWVSGG